MTVSPKEFESYFYYKYVRFNDGTILFGEVTDNHSSIANRYKQSAPVSAGKIKYCDGKYMICEYGSFTLNFASNYDDDEILKKFFSSFGYAEDVIY